MDREGTITICARCGNSIYVKDVEISVCSRCAGAVYSKGERD